MVDKVWGKDRLPSPFASPPGARIGEIWFEPPPELPQLLVKYLFTSERLSVQVHPSDIDALPGEAGKEECWLVLDAASDAQLAIGFEQVVTRAEIEAAARDGSIENFLAWFPVQAGDFFYLPAGTVHAIGAGLSLIEIQQASDTTFRLFDYGRPRELHLERGLAVAKFQPYGLDNFVRTSSKRVLVDGPHFRLDRVLGGPDAGTIDAYGQPFLAVPIAGEISTYEDTCVAGVGECLIANDINDLDFSRAEITLLTRPV